MNHSITRMRLYNGSTGTRFRPQWWISDRDGIQLDLSFLWELEDHLGRRGESRRRRDDRDADAMSLSRYHVTARVEIKTETTDVQLAGRAEDTAQFHW